MVVSRWRIQQAMYAISIEEQIDILKQYLCNDKIMWISLISVVKNIRDKTFILNLGHDPPNIPGLAPCGFHKVAFREKRQISNPRLP